MILTAILWIVASWLIGMLGMQKKFGFWGLFFGSLLFSPMIGFVFLWSCGNDYRHVHVSQLSSHQK